MSRWSDSQQSALETLARDLERVFGVRLKSLVAYAGHDSDGTVHSLALIDGLTFRDLAECLPLADQWHRRGLGVPLMLSASELRRTVDIFPLEYAGIMSTQVVLRGRNPFADIQVAPEDLRRACEAQAKSHLIHLREGFLESHGEAASIARLIATSSVPFRTVLTNIVRLPDEEEPVIDLATLSDDSLARVAESRIGIPAAVVRDILAAAGSSQITIAEPTALLSRYLDAAQRVWEYVDRWR
jgi:hypothetical protein